MAVSYIGIAVIFFMLFMPSPGTAKMPSHLVEAIILMESGGNAHATGKHGEIGLMQVKCKTVRGIGFKGECSDLYNARVNRYWGTKYLAIAYTKAKGDHCKTASLFNMGIGARPRCTKYGMNVIRIMRGLAK
jgi:soluble lytic murein transglycosylase-like protein